MSGIDNVDPDFTEEVEQLLMDGVLEGNPVAEGIAKQYVDKGAASLSNAQSAVFFKQIMPLIDESYNEQAMQHALDKDPY